MIKPVLLYLLLLYAYYFRFIFIYFWLWPSEAHQKQLSFDVSSFFVLSSFASIIVLFIFIVSFCSLFLLFLQYLYILLSKLVHLPKGRTYLWKYEERCLGCVVVDTCIQTVLQLFIDYKEREYALHQVVSIPSVEYVPI